LCVQLIGLIFIFIFAIFGLQFFSDRAEVMEINEFFQDSTDHSCVTIWFGDYMVRNSNLLAHSVAQW
jgi:hypothetical protein